MNTTDLPDIHEPALPWRVEAYMTLPLSSVRDANGRCVAITDDATARTIAEAVNAYFGREADHA